MKGAPYFLAWREQVARGKLFGPTLYTIGPILNDRSLVAEAAEAAPEQVSRYGWHSARSARSPASAQ